MSLKARNILPEWGLFNGAIGTVMDIVFQENESPHGNNLPAYVLVDFPQYTGPAMMKDNPTYVALTPVTTDCDNDKCYSCKRTQIPLELAFGKTIHTFQGINVGPVKPGQPPNQINSIVCDPGPREFESKACGLLYTACTRGSTLGNSTDNLSSAVYFTGPHMHFKRIKFLQHNATGEKCLRIRQRNQWIQHLKNNTKIRKIENNAMSAIADWYKSNCITRDNLDQLIDNMASHHQSTKRTQEDKHQTTPKKKRKKIITVTP